MKKKKWRSKTKEERIDTIAKGVKITLGGLAILGLGYFIGRITTFKEMGPLLDDEKVDRYLGVDNDEEEDDEDEDEA